jgi:hypothetical protein
MGTNVAGGGEEGLEDKARALIRSVTICEKVVLPVECEYLVLRLRGSSELTYLTRECRQRQSLRKLAMCVKSINRTDYRF